MTAGLPPDPDPVLHCPRCGHMVRRRHTSVCEQCSRLYCGMCATNRDTCTQDRAVGTMPSGAEVTR